MWMREERVCNRLLLIIALMIVGLPMSDVPAAGQGLGLADVLPDLLLREIVLNSPTSGLSHVAHFSPLEDGELNNPVVGIVEAFNSQIATQFATFPLGSSSGGMTYVFDGALGTLRRGSRSFGPSFAERALTIGRRKLNAGFNYQRTTYRQFEGQNLADGSVKFYLRHQDCCGVVITPPTFVFSATPNGTLLNPPFEGDFVEAALSLDATTNTTAFFANYGVSDRWDIGIALPVVRVDLNASVTARVVRLVTGTLPPGFVRIRKCSAWRSTPIRSRSTTPMRLGPWFTTLRRPGSAMSCSARSTSSCARWVVGSQRQSISDCRAATRTTCSAPAARR